MMHRLHFSVMQSYSVLALVGTLQQRQGALAGTRVDLRARFDATEGYFPVGAFYYYYYWGFCVNY